MSKSNTREFQQEMLKNSIQSNKSKGKNKTVNSSTVQTLELCIPQLKTMNDYSIIV